MHLRPTFDEFCASQGAGSSVWRESCLDTYVTAYAKLARPRSAFCWSPVVVSSGRYSFLGSRPSAA